MIFGSIFITWLVVAIFVFRVEGGKVEPRELGACNRPLICDLCKCANCGLAQEYHTQHWKRRHKSLSEVSGYKACDAYRAKEVHPDDWGLAISIAAFWFIYYPLVALLTWLENSNFFIKSNKESK